MAPELAAGRGATEGMICPCQVDSRRVTPVRRGLAAVQVRSGTSSAGCAFSQRHSRYGTRRQSRSRPGSPARYFRLSLARYRPDPWLPASTWRLLPRPGRRDARAAGIDSQTSDVPRIGPGGANAAVMSVSMQAT